MSFNVPAGEKPLKQSMRNEAIRWACRYDHEECIGNSLKMFQQWMAEPDSQIVPPNLKRTVTCVAVQNIGESAWEFAKSQLEKATQQQEKLDLLAGMTCSTNTTLLST